MDDTFAEMVLDDPAAGFARTARTPGDLVALLVDYDRAYGGVGRAPPLAAVADGPRLILRPKSPPAPPPRSGGA